MINQRFRLGNLPKRRMKSQHSRLGKPPKRKMKNQHSRLGSLQRKRMRSRRFHSAPRQTQDRLHHRSLLEHLPRMSVGNRSVSLSTPRLRLQLFRSGLHLTLAQPLKTHRPSHLAHRLLPSQSEKMSNRPQILHLAVLRCSRLVHQRPLHRRLCHPRHLQHRHLRSVSLPRHRHPPYHSDPQHRPCHRLVQIVRRWLRQRRFHLERLLLHRRRQRRSHSAVPLLAEHFSSVQVPLQPLQAMAAALLRRRHFRLALQHSLDQQQHRHSHSGAVVRIHLLLARQRLSPSVHHRRHRLTALVQVVEAYLIWARRQRRQVAKLNHCDSRGAVTSEKYIHTYILIFMHTYIHTVGIC